MKKMCVILACLACAAFPGPLAAQLAVVSAPVLESFVQATHVDQIIYYAQMIEQQILAAENTYNQVQNMIRAEQRAMENLKGIGDVKSFKDFMSWYNRQLYLERDAETRFKRMGVQIGNTNYKLEDIDRIPEAAKTNYGLEYWNDFSEEQRQEMWINLGMTPANYAYVQAWKAKEKQIGKILMTNAELINEENMASTGRMNDLYARTMNGDIGEKGVLQAIFEVLIDSNRVARQASYDEALAREYELAKDKLGEAPPNPPLLGNRWNEDIFAYEE